MDSSGTTKKDTTRSQLVCRICGDVARGLNFDVMTCMACKAFFRRNALRGTIRCTHKSNCEITKLTRTKCPECRLRKCFELGMKPELIRAFTQPSMVHNHVRQPITLTKQPFPLPLPQPLHIISHNPSKFIADQWSFLSNIIYMYDEHNFINNIKHMLTDGSSLSNSLPVKNYL